MREATNKQPKNLAIFDVFKSQVTQAVLDLSKNIILPIFVPVNIMHLFQPLNLTVNG